jgi:serine/threonine protein kinase
MEAQLIGLNVSHYRVVEKLGEGGMGVVYLAEDLDLERMVALKALPQHFSKDPMRRSRFKREARAAAALNHPAIATVYELLEDGEDLYIVMEFVRGESLRTVLNTAPLALKSVLDISVQIARGLSAAHAQGIIHRDLKPENILRTSSGEIKILDFGLARFDSLVTDAMTHSDNVTSSGMLMGTLSYMSPEQLECKTVDFRSDIFSFGVVLYELATSVHPFGGASAASTIANILTLEPEPLIQHRTVIPAALDRIVHTCLRKDPANRHRSAMDLQSDLETLCRDVSQASRSRSLMDPVNPPQSVIDLQSGIETLYQVASSGSHGRPLVIRDETPEGLVRSVLASIGPSPRRWWELNQFFCLVAFPLLAYSVWRIRPWLPANWSAPVLFMLVLLVSCSMTMRLYLLMMSAFNPSALHREAIRWCNATRVTTIAIWIVLGGVAAFIVKEHTGVGALMGGLAVGGLLSTVIAEAAIDLHAFPR